MAGIGHPEIRTLIGSTLSERSLCFNDKTKYKKSLKADG
jgi:hypothetical protein